MSFTLPPLKYANNALEPYIDARTMEIHHDKHHAAYTLNLNNAIKDTALDQQSIEQILKNLDMSNMPLRNNAGGYYNHNMFWEIIGPHDGDKPSGEIANGINQEWGSFEVFKEKFSASAMGRFGSGWAWLTVQKGGKLEIVSTPNQDNPLMPNTAGGGFPVLGLDVWEHAYYLLYQNRRAEYVNAFFQIINWKEVNNRYLDGKG